MNICADCRNPVNTCSWEREFKPVDGWVAKETIVMVQGRPSTSYNVVDCPLFTPPLGYKRKKTGVPKPVITRNIVTGEETIYPSTKKASVAFGVAETTVRSYARYGGILYGNSFRYAKAGDGL